MNVHVVFTRMWSCSLRPIISEMTNRLQASGLSARHVFQSIKPIEVGVMSKRDVEASLLKEVTRLRANLDASRREACGGVSMMDVANAAEIGILANLPTLSAVHNLRAHTGRIRTCTWAASDENLLSIGADNYICIWDVRSGLIRNIIDITMNQATAADSTPDLSVVFAGASVDGVVLWDINNVKMLSKCSHNTDVSAVLPLSSDGRSFVSGATDGVPRIWDVRQSRPFVCSMHGHESEISCVERHANEHTFVTGSDDAAVNLYDVRLDFPLASYNRTDAKSTTGDGFVSTENKYLNHSGMDDEGNNQITDEDAATTGVTGVGVSTSGRIIISGSRNGCIYIWDIFDLMSPVAVHREQGPVMALKMAHNKKGLAVITWGSAAQLQINGASPWPPKIGTYEQVVSHFDFHFHPLTFKQRFVYEGMIISSNVNFLLDIWYRTGGPIFFYCGNEGNILEFWNNTGFMFDIAPMFNALIVFAEHRYYGESTPFLNSFVQPYIGFLSIQEAMADFADLISVLKIQFNATSSPVIAFGGRFCDVYPNYFATSYGGMLAAYMRLRYPHIITGAVAASAPFKWVTGEEGLHPFFESIKEAYFNVSELCVPIIQAAYSEILRRSREGTSGLKNVTAELNLCTLLETGQDLDWMLRWSRNAFVVMSMMNYPYPSYGLPANPVNVSCNKAIEFGVQNPLAGLREAVGVLYDRSSELCFDYKTQYIDCADVTGCGLGNDSVAWDFQACTEIHLYDPSNATSNDLFPSLPKSLGDVDEYCFKKGGNPADPPSVKVARQAEIEAISGWLKEYENSRYDH
ncbi:Dipeptidyl peptidase 2 [Echinococcus granulosus]|uniref:Dipeptidyl peptidase 2 n=1 Tax=Echinococcus granulosus TaxID=6210 RepID=W6UNH5_ECHGR|nr:Dipeptidyl peptidase 2 [Echinococcus granulosus]EUB62748.1 Dipeptidyl peptidase 2 [Echinococcus granulosus]